MEIKVLCEPASHCPKQLGLGVVLRALADDRHFQLTCHPDRVSQYNLFLDPGSPVTRKASVQPEDICGQLLELSQGRIAGAGVINGSQESQFLRPGKYGDNGIGIFKKNAFRDLDLQKIFRDLIKVGNATDLFQRIRFYKVRS